MTERSISPHVARIRVYPVKSLNPLERTRTTVRPDGGLGVDRSYAVVDAEGEYVNGKREAAVHRIDATYADDGDTLVLRDRDGERDAESFRLADADDREGAAAWLTAHYGYDVAFEHAERGGYPDDTTASGPTVISTATLREIGSWFDLPIGEVRRRFRPNLEIGGVPAFWEDRLYADREHTVRVRVGDAVFEGTNPCSRCVVPTRDSRTGERDPEFQRTFVEKREATLPAWADESWYERGYYQLMVNTAVPEGTTGATLTVGDDVEVLGVSEGNPQG
ncbi:molybdenum cofactor biosysynthesis protein [Halarchaeum grantii]|uniref:Molybdenum cofactor biosysynthesis protein n=1 Tax=Halarchaeum grantii TaxID=1193105 RepID=A0A830FE52_9EURY|nr:MOSC N-terminal beta barrel domain-containing protein [Halarchaeum grantii]GGL37683.1 molybdenum cofactor biosysynthesis protein [Halarchaeum grantii]